MRLIGVMSAIGGAISAIVGVVAHFASRTVPSTFYVGTFGPDDGGRVSATLGTPLVHPSWSPTLPVSIIVGLAVGAAVGLVMSRVGVEVVRRRSRRGGDAGQG